MDFFGPIKYCIKKLQQCGCENTLITRLKTRSRKRAASINNSESQLQITKALNLKDLLDLSDVKEI